LQGDSGRRFAYFTLDHWLSSHFGAIEPFNPFKLFTPRNLSPAASSHSARDVPALALAQARSN
jgi:hypothetical protein